MTTPVTSWADGPMVALDLETTNIDPRRDRVITAAVVMISPTRPGERPDVTTRTWLADPEVEIPADATAINGITTEQARRDGRPAVEVIAEVVAQLAEVWIATTPLCAFNAAFDLTMLDAELQRHHDRSLRLSGPVIDPLCIDRHLDPDRSGARNLTAVCAHYNVRLEGAHTSTGDALAAARLAWRLARTHPARIGSLAPHVLHSQQAGWFRDHELAYAEKLEHRVRRLTTEGGDAADVDQLRACAEAARASARLWPILLATPNEREPLRRRLPARPGGPANSHATWTADQDATLRDEWLASDPALHAEALREDIAARHGRSPGAIRSRLLRLMCDAELPGHTCDEHRAAELKGIYDAEYRRRNASSP